MKLHDLRPDTGSKRKRKRIGRGIAQGQGRSGGRGTKGQHARRGKPKGAYFEGGQLPLVRRLPFKRGFNNIFRIQYQEVNVGRLAELADGTLVTPALLAAAGIIRDALAPVVVLGDGDLGKKLTVHAHRFSKSAEQKITAAGGTIERLALRLTGVRATVRRMRKEDLQKLYSNE